jgi:hypothetical protein
MTVDTVETGVEPLDKPADERLVQSPQPAFVQPLPVEEAGVTTLASDMPVSQWNATGLHSDSLDCRPPIWRLCVQDASSRYSSDSSEASNGYQYRPS